MFYFISFPWSTKLRFTLTSCDLIASSRNVIPQCKQSYSICFLLITSYLYLCTCLICLSYNSSNIYRSVVFLLDFSKHIPWKVLCTCGSIVLRSTSMQHFIKTTFFSVNQNWKDLYVIGIDTQSLNGNDTNALIFYRYTYAIKEYISTLNNLEV